MRMNLYPTPDKYKKEADEILKDTGAFLRISRGEGLFVTDAPRRDGAETALEILKNTYDAFIADGLMYLTPKYGFLSPETEKTYTRILKANMPEKEKIIRTSLAAAMRKKNAEDTAIYKILLERIQNI